MMYELQEAELDAVAAGQANGVGGLIGVALNDVIDIGEVSIVRVDRNRFDINDVLSHNNVNLGAAVNVLGAQNIIQAVRQLT